MRAIHTDFTQSLKLDNRYNKDLCHIEKKGKLPQFEEHLAFFFLISEFELRI